MNIPEAVKLYTAMSLLDPYAKARTDEEVALIAEQIANTLPSTPLSWALEFVQRSYRDGKVPAVTDIAAAWAPEARRRVESVPVPPAPAHIEADHDAWREWERTRRRALVAGATPQQAHAYANRQLGAKPPTAQIEGSARPPGEAKRIAMEKLREWERAQREAEASGFFEEEGDL